MGKDPKEQAMLDEIAKLDAEAADGNKPPEAPIPQPKPVEKPAEPTPKAEVPPEPKPAEKPEERKVFTMPVSKHTAQMDNLKKQHEAELAAREAQIRAEYEAKVQELKTNVDSSKSTQEEDEFIKKYADETGVSEDTVKGILALAEKRALSKIPQPKSNELPADVSQSLAEFKQEREIAQAKAQVEKDFADKILPKIKQEYPEATLDHIQKVKDSIMDLAFTSEYNTYRLEDIYAVKHNDFAFKTSMSAESSRGGSGETVSFDNITPEQLAAMSVEDAERYFKYYENKGSRYLT